MNLPFVPQIRLACPYCYRKFPEWDIEFRCSGRPGIDGNQCEPIRDELFTKNFGGAGERPHTFKDRRHRYASVCPESKAETTTRVCPRCHSTLPVHFGRIPSQQIALVGARDSGKTVFMTVLMHEFGYKLGARLGAAVSGADDETRNTFRRDYENRLYEGNVLPNPTFTVEQERQGYRPPMVFKFERQNRQTFLSFFDTAGEDLNNDARVELNTQYLKAADAVILILDPLQMDGGRRLAAADALPRAAQAEDDPYNALVRITGVLKAGRRPGRVRKPLAVVLTKLDALYQEFPAGSPLQQPQPEAPAFDDTDNRKVHEYILAQLRAWDGERIDSYLHENYKRFRYFGVSALGAVPTRDRRIVSTISPYRVGDPALWLLSEARMVPVTRER